MTAHDPHPDETDAPFDVTARPALGVRHILLGSVCLCGGWSAGCGHDVPEQWRQHVNATERTDR